MFMAFTIKRTRDLLQDLNYKALFNELGWSNPGNSKPVIVEIPVSYTQREIAELSGVAIFEITMSDGKIPNEHIRRDIHKNVSLHHLENLLLFLDSERTQSLWYWLKRTDKKSEPRTHLYVKGQPGNLSLGMLENMVFDVADFNATGSVSVLEVAKRLQNALDVEQVTKRFYEDYRNEHLRFLEKITGIDDDRDRRWYASVLLNRLMFVYFLQRKWFIDNRNADYLQEKLQESQRLGTNIYYSDFLQLLFFEGFAKPESERSEAAKARLGIIRYLNGGLFLPHPIEKRWSNIAIPDEAFSGLFSLFERYSWNLDDAPGGNDNEISPHILGYIFEKYINQKTFGAYYTRPEITEYLCEQTIHKLILEKINTVDISGVMRGRQFDSVEELVLRLDARLCRDLLVILPSVSLLDPACGSGAFLVSAMNVLTKMYGAVVGRIAFLNDSYLTDWLRKANTEHDSLNYYIKKKIITENLFGVDIMEEGTEIAKLRLFLALVSSVQSVEQLEPLPNIDFNILPGNSLIGLLYVNQERLTQLNLFQRDYQEVVDEKNRLVEEYKGTSKYTDDLRALRDNIQTKRDEAISTLNELLLDDFNRLGVKYEQATWDEVKQTDGKPKKRALQMSDIARLNPFHWGYEFDKVMAHGGFDIIITNPPWEILKPQAKEFFATHSVLVTKNKMRIEDFEQESAKLLQDSEIREAWLDYQSAFPYQSAYFRATPQYINQIATVNGKKAGTDINLYKLFTEQCYNLLRNGGQCGIVIPSGIYTDLGAKQLREMLFDKTLITGLFGFENRKLIFEGVDSRFKFVVLTFEKGPQTQAFPTAFMRHDVAELERFPRSGALHMSVELIRKLSPDSLSIMELKSPMDLQIAQKMLHFSPLGEKLADTWNVTLGNEFHMTNDHRIFRNEPGTGRLPLYEGKMIHQFMHQWSRPRYWVDEKEGRKAVLGRNTDMGQTLNYQTYRLGYRAIARNTDERTMIATVLPPLTFFGHSINATHVKLSSQELLFITSMLNSFVVDFSLRQRVTANLTMFYIYQLPVPRFIKNEAIFSLIVSRAARLICTTPEYQELWQAVMPGSDWSTDVAATDQKERAKLRAELDGIIAHLYGLTKEEFQYVLGTFPLVEQQVKDDALIAYDAFSDEPENMELVQLIESDESQTAEFKVAACWNAQTNRKDDGMKNNIVYAVASFLNSSEGGTLLIGVDNNKQVIGIEEDIKAANPQRANQDAYQLFLQKILTDNLQGVWTDFYEISFGVVRGKTVCKIAVSPTNKVVFLRNGDLYIRDGNSKRKLSAYEATEYRKLQGSK